MVDSLLLILIGVVLYTYLGYPLLLYLMVVVKRLFSPKKEERVEDELPHITLLVAAYNERDWVARKVENSLTLNYPKEKLHHLWVTDGSDDGTPELLQRYPEIELLHQSKREGKSAALNRAIEYVKTPIVVFSDANTTLGKESLMVIANLFNDPKVGCVAGEKRVASEGADSAAGSGESIYWRYESQLKRWDAELNSAVGAAGELFAVRKELYKAVDERVILDDFIISMTIAMEGYKIAYDPEAYALEGPSASVNEEMKRKVRIAAGGVQSVVMLLPLLNPFKYGLLSFQYFSHRFLRWSAAPFALPLILLLNAFLLNNSPHYQLLFLLQLLFYSAAFLGWKLQEREVKIKLLFVPFYFTMMNWAIIRGAFRYFSGKQSAKWERAKRAQ